jgi:putative redox protein
MRFETVTFPNRQGQMLSGRIDLPLSGDPVAYALFAHCFTCSKNLRSVGRITQTLAHHGIATLRFDFAGLGDSEGDFADTNFTSNTADLVAAADFLANGYEAPEVIVGHSHGGAVALKVAGGLESVRAVVTIGTPATPEHIKHHLVGDLDAIEAHGEAEVMLAGRPFTIKKQFLDDIESADLDVAIRTLGRPLLVLHSPLDNTVGVDNAGRILELARHPKSFISLDDADHLLSDEADARYVAEIIASWADRYISGSLASHSQPDFLVDAPESVTMVRTGEGFRTEIVSNGFPLVADEPASVGGTNTGPTPHDYLLTALGSCTSMTLRMYADKKDWPLDEVLVRLTHRKVHTRDCDECETEGGYVDHITREVELVGALDTTQRQRLLEIADRCPVHKTLHGEVVVRSDLTTAS